MARTKYYKYNEERKGLTDKQRRFVLEYLVDYDATRAARVAGYRAPESVGSELLKKPEIARSIGKQEQKTAEHLKLSREEVLKQLYFCATRSAKDFCDETGRIITDVHLLTERAQNTIDGIKQKVDSYRDSTGKLHETVTTELKLVPKITAIDLAMKHKGLFQPDQMQVKHSLDWDALFEHIGGQPAETHDEFGRPLKKVIDSDQDFREPDPYMLPYADPKKPVRYSVDEFVDVGDSYEPDAVAD